MLARWKKREEILRKLPEVLDIQKKKLLLSMEQPPDGAAEKFSAEQEMLVKEVTQTLQSMLGVSESKSYTASCTEIINQGNKALKRSATFQLEKYLKCVKNICTVFEHKYNDILQSQRQIVYDAMEYILTHARQFSDPSKSIFDMETEAATTMPKQVDINQGHELPIVNRATALIEELYQAYDEEKFRSLNALATSFTLVIARRFIKQKQHQNHNTRPIYWRSIKQKQHQNHNTTPIYCLIVRAYLTTDDEKTKKNLYDTCIKHMEWYDMHMPSLFFKVLDLYNIDAGELWDALMSTTQMKHVEQRIMLSLIEFAEAYYDFRQKLEWFPFFVFLSEKSSDESNVRICMVLHSLVEMASKQVYKVNYTDMAIYSDWAKKTAVEIMTKITK